jgi:hypothetical protein
MLEFLRGKASDWKLRLFAVACVLPVSHLQIERSSVKAAGELRCNMRNWEIEGKFPWGIGPIGAMHSPCRLVFQKEELGLFLYSAGLLEKAAEVGFEKIGRGGNGPT